MRFQVMARPDGTVEIVDATLGTRKSVKMEVAAATNETISVPEMARIASFKVCSVPTAA